MTELLLLPNTNELLTSEKEEIEEVKTSNYWRRVPYIHSRAFDAVRKLLVHELRNYMHRNTSLSTLRYMWKYYPACFNEKGSHVTEYITDFLISFMQLSDRWLCKTLIQHNSE